MVHYIKEYGVFVKIAGKHIVAYDTEEGLKTIDYSSVGIMCSIDEEFADKICEALKIDSVEEYGVKIQNEDNYE